METFILKMMISSVIMIVGYFALFTNVNNAANNQSNGRFFYPENMEEQENENNADDTSDTNV